jgi:ADP-heptose:LPS heptosyltransferase
LKKNLPEAHITVLMSSKTRNMLELDPYVDEIKICDLFSRSSRRPGIVKLIGFARKHTWGGNYELAVVLNWIMSTRLSIFAQLCVRPLRVIYHAYYLTRNRNLFYRLSRFMPRELMSVEHETEHNLRILEYIGGRVASDRVKLWLDAKDRSFADRLFSESGSDQGDFNVAFCPGAYYPSHRWPVSNYAALAEWLSETRRDLKIFIFGGRGEEYLAEEICERLPGRAVNLIGTTSLRESLAVLQKCHLYIGNDTGAMHLASAAQLPVVDITCHRKNNGFDVEKYPHRYAPWQVKHVIVQPRRNRFPCIGACKRFTEQHCIGEVSMDDVKQAVANLWSVTRRGKVELNEA